MTDRMDRKPLREQRYKCGQSGNMKGRPRRPKPFGSLLDRELRKKISVTENGETKIITKREALCKVIAGKALSGNKRIRRLAFNLLRQIDQLAENYEPYKFVITD